MSMLLVEDDALLADGLIPALRRGGFVINHVAEGEMACLYIKTEFPNIVILDLGLPDMDGREVLKCIQKYHPVCQVLVLSGRNTLRDKVSCLDAGAADYMSKPFESEELMARLRVLERRLGTSVMSKIVVGSVILNTATCETTVSGKNVKLSRKEYLLLKALMENDQAIHSREKLEDKLCPWGNEMSSNAIDVHIHNLRKKLPSGFIQTMHGLGYMIKNTCQVEPLD